MEEELSILNEDKQLDDQQIANALFEFDNIRKVLIEQFKGVEKVRKITPVRYGHGIRYEWR